jgi:hypothetical protein
VLAVVHFNTRSCSTRPLFLRLLAYRYRSGKQHPNLPWSLDAGSPDFLHAVLSYGDYCIAPYPQFLKLLSFGITCRRTLGMSSTSERPKPRFMKLFEDVLSPPSVRKSRLGLPPEPNFEDQTIQRSGYGEDVTDADRWWEDEETIPISDSPQSQSTLTQPINERYSQTFLPDSNYGTTIAQQAERSHRKRQDSGEQEYQGGNTKNK